MVQVRRSLVVVVVGWASGFLIAIAWGATRANNPQLASILSGWAIGGMVVTGLLLISIALSDLAERRRAGRSAARPEPQATSAPTLTEARRAARIAQLEEHLAHEQQELDAAVASLAATGHRSAGMVDPVPDPGAAALEPVLRQEVVDAVAQLVARTDPAQEAELAGELEALLEKAR
jgi:hypothetical protein